MVGKRQVDQCRYEQTQAYLLVDWCAKIPRISLPFVIPMRVSHLIVGKRSKDRSHFCFVLGQI